MSRTSRTEGLLSLPGRHKGFLLEAFVTLNLAFLTADIFMAHSTNGFRAWSEWIPFWYTSVGALILATNLVATLLSKRRFHEGTGRWLGFVVGVAGILVGILGFLLHLESSFFQALTLRSLVYAAPFVAPLAFAGLGLLALLNRMVEQGSRRWGTWVVFLAMGGFFGNFGISLSDHAQNGFFYAQEWIPVCSAALAVGWLTVVVIGPAGREFVRWGLGVMALQVAVGLLGEFFHLRPALTKTAGRLFDRLIYGAPVFPPLLFANLAALAALGLWAILDAREGDG